MSSENTIYLDVERFGRTALEELVAVTARNWTKVVLDVGSGNKLSTNVKAGQLLVMVDPEMTPFGDWGSNGVDGNGMLAMVKASVDRVGNVFYRMADRVQIIAPNPDPGFGDLENMVYGSVDTVKKGGLMVMAFDRNSDKRDWVEGAGNEARKIMVRSGFRMIAIGNLGQAVGGRPNSEFNLGRIVAGRKK